MKAWAVLRHDMRKGGFFSVPGAYLDLAAAAEAAGGMKSWASWREPTGDDLVDASLVLPGEQDTWYIIPVEVHPAHGWWAVHLALELARDCLRVIARGGKR